MLLGHTLILEHLKALGEAGKLHHAQLFIGPEHVGKTHTALLLATQLQGAAENTLLKKHIFEGLHADTLVYLDDGEPLSIETVRGIVSRSAESHQAPFLIFIIENLGRMKPEAVSVLLKTLEEPGPDTLFLLIAHQEEDVLPTLRSRSHVTSFQTVANPELERACEDHVQTPQLLLFAMGRPGKLQRLKTDPAYLASHQEALQDLLKFLENPSTPAAYQFIRRYENNPLLPEMLDILLQRARTWALSGDIPTVLAHLDFTTILDQIETSKQDLKAHVNTKLVLENLFLPFASTL